MDFRAGDKVKVSYKIKEGSSFRSQVFEGIVLCIKGEGNSKTFTVRKIGAEKIGVERIFPVSSPNLEKVEVTHKSKLRRAKAYYLRKLSEKEIRSKVK